MNTLSEYLHAKHWEYCNKKGRKVNENEWVMDVLNSKLGPGDKLSSGSVNQWMNGGRSPDATNVNRLYKVFGAEVMPYLGIEFSPELANFINRWPDLSPEKRKEIMQILENTEKESMEV